MVSSSVSFIVGIIVAILLVLAVCLCCCINPTCFYFQDAPGVPNKMKVRKRHVNQTHENHQKENQRTSHDSHKHQNKNIKPKTFNQRSKPQKRRFNDDVERADEHLLRGECEMPPSYEETCMIEEKDIGSETSV